MLYNYMPVLCQTEQFFSAFQAVFLKRTTINRCPTCGIKLKMRSAGEHQCQCGALLWICKMVGQTPIVAAFAVRSPAAKLIDVLDDTI